jgi:hypothetical protein
MDFPNLDINLFNDCDYSEVEFGNIIFTFENTNLNINLQNDDICIIISFPEEFIVYDENTSIDDIPIMSSNDTFHTSVNIKNKDKYNNNEYCDDNDDEDYEDSEDDYPHIPCGGINPSPPDLYTFAMNINVLRIMSGLGSLSYST